MSKCQAPSPLDIGVRSCDNPGMRESECPVVSNSVIRGNYHLMKIESEYISTQCRPGNFVMLAVTDGTDPLLKRPFGIFRSDPPCFYIYYEVVGKGSRMLASKKKGDKIRAVGPLGNSFPVLSGRNILMIGGGRGIAPLVFAMDRCAGENHVSLVYGAGTSDDLLLTEELEKLPLRNRFFFTEDGSGGFRKGTVITGIREIIKENHIDVTFSCGPDRMFEALNEETEDLGIENYASLEAYMGCGFGICHSCVVTGSDGKYKKVCSDGPVFRMEDIRWRT